MRPSSKSHIGVDFTMSSNVPPESRDSSAPPRPQPRELSKDQRVIFPTSELLSSKVQGVLVYVSVARRRSTAHIYQVIIVTLHGANHIPFAGSLRGSRHHSRAGSWGQRLVTALTSERHGPKDQMRESKNMLTTDDRVWYDQFTSTDWVHDSIADAYRVKGLRSRKDFRGRIKAFFDGTQGWILSALVGFVTATIAYTVDVSETPIYDWKDGYCHDGFFISEKRCCPNGDKCDAWKSWSNYVEIPFFSEDLTEFFIYVLLVVAFASAACLLTLTTKTVVPSTYQLSTLDENLGAFSRHDSQAPVDGNTSPKNTLGSETNAPMIYYSAAGSGVAEVRVILSGFVLHGFLGFKTLLVKTLALILSVASGLSLGKEGPFVHIATCVGNIACRLFSKYDDNDGKRREVLSAAAAAGVAVAFGAPIGGVLFSLEEVAYFFPAKTLFRTFFCCITAALTLKFLNPYGTNKIVMFEVRYLTDWTFFELAAFIMVGVLGGITGATFIKASRSWAQSFRKIEIIKSGLFLRSCWLLYSQASSPIGTHSMGLCPNSIDEIFPIIGQLTIAFFIKGLLTIITFGIKVPAGIYVPSMVVGGLLGRIVGHLVQWLVLTFPQASIFESCAAHESGTSCITPGVYALIAAGSTMCGVTRLSVTLAVILFELTGSLDYVLPFSLAVLVSKWTADFMEPLSIYDLLTNLNAYPFLNNKHKPIFTSDLADIVPRVRRERKLELLHQAGEVDGGLPIIRDDVLVGLIPAPDLEFALDNLDNEPGTLCLMATISNYDDSEEEERVDPTDFTPYIDPAPVALDIRSPMDLVYECFVKLGLRYVCVLKDGRYAGLTHKKTFVKYMRELEERDGHN
ncbi:voltage gated chloride channel [Botrytis cinerea]